MTKTVVVREPLKSFDDGSSPRLFIYLFIRFVVTVSCLVDSSRSAGYC